MDGELLTTRFQVPVSRQRLVRRGNLPAPRDAGALPRLTLAVAPAGWGKTTLFATWLTGAERPPRHAWVSLEDGDNSPFRFWANVVESLRRAEPRLAPLCLEALRTSEQETADGVPRGLLNRLATLPEPVILVLDDYHVIDNPLIHDGMRLLIDRAPPALRCLVATRTDPPWPLPRLRLAGELHEIRTRQLRFDRAQAAALLTEMLGPGLAEAGITRLWESTEGWVAGLRLAVLSLRAAGDLPAAVAAFDGDDRHVVDYLEAEVLARQPGPVRAFLLRTCVLDRLCVPQCDVVTGRGDAARVLELVDERELFLVALDSRREWYRYHRLFAGALRHRLARTDPELADELHRRACRWYAEHGMGVDAIHHAFLAGDGEPAAELITEHWEGILHRGGAERLSSWLEALPPQRVADDPRLCLAAAWAAVSLARGDEAESWMKRARRRGGDRDDPAVPRQAIVLGEANPSLLGGDVTSTIAAARRALRVTDRQPSWNAIALVALGASLFWAGLHEEAEPVLNDARDVARSTGISVVLIYALGCLAGIRIAQGRVREAERLVGQAMDEIERSGMAGNPFVAIVHRTHGQILERLHPGEDASDALRHAVELGRLGPGRVDLSASLIALAGNRIAAGHTGEAGALLAEARRVLATCPDPGIVPESLARAERRLLAVLRRPLRSGSPPVDLTDRELAVLRLLPSSLSRVELAENLCVSRNTLKTHLRNIYRKLDAADRAAAVARGRRLGLLLSVSGSVTAGRARTACPGSAVRSRYCTAGCCAGTTLGSCTRR